MWSCLGWIGGRTSNGSSIEGSKDNSNDREEMCTAVTLLPPILIRKGELTSVTDSQQICVPHWMRMTWRGLRHYIASVIKHYSNKDFPLKYSFWHWLFCWCILCYNKKPTVQLHFAADLPEVASDIMSDFLWCKMSSIMVEIRIWFGCYSRLHYSREKNQHSLHSVNWSVQISILEAFSPLTLFQ